MRNQKRKASAQTLTVLATGLIERDTETDHLPYGSGFLLRRVPELYTPALFY